MMVLDEPREIIKSIPGLVFNEMKRPDACCGSGGSYVLTHYETGAAIGKRKMDDVNHTAADTITTGCPGCAMQLLDLSIRHGKGQKVRHYISLLAESYTKESAT